MSTLPVVFANTSDIYNCAYQMLHDYILPSLENDVNVCLQYNFNNVNPPTNAYIPALLYCFSVIDLLGSIVYGHARSKKTSENSIKYMQNYMGYNPDDANFIQKMYRHKMVHLAMPKAAMLDKGKIISWKLHDTTNHCYLDSKDQGEIDLFGFGKIYFNGKYILNIQKFREDISNSVITPKNGYLEKLKNDVNLQYNFVLAFNQIYDPIVTD